MPKRGFVGGVGGGYQKGPPRLQMQIKQKGCTPYSTSWTGRLDFQPIFVHGDEVLDHE
jgi:hypothetical protein